jgi:hypothetical protein
MDWQAVHMLSDWTCDGVLINIDDDVDIDDSEQPILSRDDGALLNVAIQGPTPMRNTKWNAMNMREGHEYEPQHVDSNIAALDKVFVGLFSIPELDEAGKLTRVGFRFKCFSGRQLLNSAFGQSDARRNRSIQDEQNIPNRDVVQSGPVDLEFKLLVGAWRVGSVMDNRHTTDVERRVLLNVCVEWWSLSKLWCEYVDAEQTLVRFPPLDKNTPPNVA